MNTNESSLELLLKRSEDYSKTSLELLRLQTIEKAADVLSSIVYLFILYILLAISSLIISIGMAILIGSLLSNIALGYFVVGAFYLILSLMIFIFKKAWIKGPFNDLFISQLHNSHTS